MSTTKHQITVRRHADGSIELVLEADDNFCDWLVKTVLGSGSRRSLTPKTYNTRTVPKSTVVFEIARRWVDNLRNDPLMSHSIKDEVERWGTREGISREQLTKNDRSRIRHYVISAERFLEAKLRKHGLRFEISGNRYHQIRRLTEPFIFPDATNILTEGENSEPTSVQ
jgi:hypothetical protein